MCRQRSVSCMLSCTHSLPDMARFSSFDNHWCSVDFCTMFWWIPRQHNAVSTRWGPRPPQKFRKSHWCVPFTATFSKRRKIGALWSERCDVLNCQNIIYLFLIKFLQVTLSPKVVVWGLTPGHRILSQPTSFTSGESGHSNACWAPGHPSVRTLQRLPAAERSSVPGLANAQNARRERLKFQGF